MIDREKIGVGLVSVGWMGRLHSRAYGAVRHHFPELAAQPRLVIAADTEASGRAYAADVLGYAATTADYREVIDHADVDVVSICAPAFLHHEVALAAIAAGKPFWIEKPMGRDADEARDIAERAADAGLVTAVGFNYRHAPAVAHARDLIAAGRIGRVTNVRVSFLADYSADPQGALTWRFRRELAGSGVLGDLLSHGIDLAAFLVGDVRSVTAATSTFIAERPIPDGAASHFSIGAADAPRGFVENEDHAVVVGRFDGGAVGVFEASRVARGPRAEYVVEVYGTDGSVRWDFERMNELKVAGADGGYRTVLMEPGFGEFGRFQPGAGTGMGFDDLKTIEASLFLRSVIDGKQAAPSAADAWRAAEVVRAALASATDGAWHDVRPVPPA